MTRCESLETIEEKDLNLLMKVALGKVKADLAIINAAILNVFTGELLDNYAVGVKGKWIAYLGDAPELVIGDNTTIIDAKGKILIPGLIDGHTHLAWLYSVNEFLPYAIKGGTTAIITETMEVFPVMGYEGVLDFMASLHHQPIKLFSTAPAMVSTSKKTFGISTDIIQKLMTCPDIVGLGESYWQGVLQKAEQMLPVFKETLTAGKTLEGHSAGARGNKLAAYVAAGISSCHEPTNAAEVLERLRLGLHVMVREGSIRRELEAVSEIKDSGIDFRRMILVTDGVEPEDLMEKGYMDVVVQKAIDYGFDPITAIQMATLNVAEHFSLDHLMGAIAPGRYADMLILPDLKTIVPEYVISSGTIVAKQGEVLIPSRKHFFREDSRKSIHLPKEMKPSDFFITPSFPLVSKPELENGKMPIHEGGVRGISQAEVRIIDMVTDLVTREIKMTVPVSDGEIKTDIEEDIIKVAAIDRTHTPGKMFTGLIRGFHMKSGAMASSAAWDTSDIIVVGADDADMALAVNRIHDLQGGAVVCNNGEILAEIPLPVFGLIADMPVDILAERMKQMKRAIAGLGVAFPDPLLSLVTLTGAAIPYLRICEEGLVNLKNGETVGLIV